MFSGRKSAEKRREQIETADAAVADAMKALNIDDLDAARAHLGMLAHEHSVDKLLDVGTRGRGSARRAEPR